MNITPKARVAIVVALATVLLTGCSAAAPGTEATSAPTATAGQPTPNSAHGDFTDRATKGQIGATVIKVLTPRSFVVGPNAFEQKQNKLSGELTVQIRADSDLVTPAQGACGYDETLAFVTQYFTTNPENAYVLAGDFASDEYYQDLIRAGFAYIPNNEGILKNVQADAQDAKTGLWTTCPGFGA
ncbi:hypothetical protein [Cryobacterium zhongshanensis]|uniref:TNase-like domain-containing protein n=1 Tax=Cryobacterium zhongshanensis TaxID=2928153 RepID=A0AA41R2J2_9MICO|nr:hypothetical protein [Cryobacterium zhongshanensis]MCI4659686.1 hypothetical protein [Cryobacterium zhongshanensis]